MSFIRNAIGLIIDYATIEYPHHTYIYMYAFDEVNVSEEGINEGDRKDICMERVPGTLTKSPLQFVPGVAGYFIIINPLPTNTRNLYNADMQAIITLQTT